MVWTTARNYVNNGTDLIKLDKWKLFDHAVTKITVTAGDKAGCINYHPMSSVKVV